ncbi:MAG: hypothetical protein MI975_00215 [Cytophagales bacterium]|nr:hypothetical protein [Cytophagales bacterium]
MKKTIQSLYLAVSVVMASCISGCPDSTGLIESDQVLSQPCPRVRC